MDPELTWVVAIFWIARKPEREVSIRPGRRVVRGSQSKRPPSAARVHLSYNLEEIAATQCGSRTFSQKTGDASVSAFWPKADMS